MATQAEISRGFPLTGAPFTFILKSAYSINAIKLGKNEDLRC
jgi:hypothetical protein